MLSFRNFARLIIGITNSSPLSLISCFPKATIFSSLDLFTSELPNNMHLLLSHLFLGSTSPSFPFFSIFYLSFWWITTSSSLLKQNKTKQDKQTHGRYIFLRTCTSSPLINNLTWFRSDTISPQNSERIIPCFLASNVIIKKTKAILILDCMKTFLLFLENWLFVFSFWKFPMMCLGMDLFSFPRHSMGSFWSGYNCSLVLENFLELFLWWFPSLCFLSALFLELLQFTSCTL